MLDEKWVRQVMEDGNSLDRFQNESGVFWRDADGMLMEFEADPENISDRENPYRNLYLKELLIPEGIKQIGALMYGFAKNEDELCLRYIRVYGKLQLPNTLTTIGASGFSDSFIAHMELPASLREIGPGAMMHCRIHELRIPKGLPEPVWCWPENDQWEQAKRAGLACGGRQFKESTIDILMAPENYPYQKLMPEAEIGKIVFY